MNGSCPHCGAPYPAGATYCASCGMALTAGAKRSDRGLKTILIVVGAGGCLLLLIAVLGIVAALVIPNFLDALQKAKQKRTVADMRSISTALESYRADNNKYPSGDGAQVAPLLASRGYQGQLQDGWKRPLRYTCLSTSDEGCISYELASGGRDGTFEHQPGGYENGTFALNEYDSDVVIVDGMFDRWPAGAGRSGGG